MEKHRVDKCLFEENLNKNQILTHYLDLLLSVFHIDSARTLFGQNDVNRRRHSGKRETLIRNP